MSGPARRLSGTVFVGSAFGMVALCAAFTAAPLVAEDLTGSRTWSGLPGAAAIAGTHWEWRALPAHGNAR